MIKLLHSQATRRALWLALPFALCLTILFPATSEAHAILLRSDPQKDAVLSSAPSQVRMWFSEDLNPTFSKAVVVNVSNQHVDKNDSHVSTSDTKEMDLSLQPNLPAGAYVVVWRTQSADDGHVLSGSFIFKVAALDGTVPNTPGQLPGANALGGGNTSVASGQLDGPTFFSFVMVTLVELGVIFWVGAQLWRTFVLQLTDGDNPEQAAIDRDADRRFERVFSLPTLLVILLANIGVLVGQGLLISGGNWSQAFAPALLSGLASNGRFGTYWSMREIVILVASAVSIYTLIVMRRGKRPPIVDSVLPWVNLVLGLALLIAMTLSGHAAAVSSNIMVYAVLSDWLHLLAASLWIGGMLYLATIYLPVVMKLPMAERTRALLSTLPQFSPLAIVGVIIMAVTGPFNATVHMDSFGQLISTAYGRTLLVKSGFVGLLLLTSAIHVGLLRPRLRKIFDRYEVASDRTRQKVASEAEEKEEREEEQEERTLSSVEVKQLEAGVAGQSHRLTTILRWEPLLGVAVLICVGLMNVFAGTLLPAAANQPQQQQSTPVVKPYNATLQTTDKQFTVKVTVSPNRFGTNVFTVNVLDSSGKPDTNVGVSVYTTMLDMDMGTDTVNLKPNGKGGFSANGDLNMGGDWQLRIQIRTPDNKLHEATTKMYTAF